MKHLYILALLMINLVVKAQCTPDNTIPNPGFYPPAGTTTYPNNGDTIYVMPYGTVGQAYSEIVQFKIPLDTSANGIPFTIDSVQILNFPGLPAGIQYQCNQANGIYLGGEIGCVTFSGTPLAPDSSEVKVHGSFSASNPILGAATFEDSLRINIYAVINGNGSSINEFNKAQVKFYPNPATTILNVEASAALGSSGTFEIIDLTGKLVLKEDITPGQKLSINVKALQNGLYLYRINSDTYSRSGKFLVKH